MHIEWNSDRSSETWHTVDFPGEMRLVAGETASVHTGDEGLAGLRRCRLRFASKESVTYFSDQFVKAGDRFTPLHNSNGNGSEFARHRAGIIVFICLGTVVIILGAYLILRN